MIFAPGAGGTDAPSGPCRTGARSVQERNFAEHAIAMRRPYCQPWDLRNLSASSQPNGAAPQLEIFPPKEQPLARRLSNSPNPAEKHPAAAAAKSRQHSPPAAGRFRRANRWTAPAHGYPGSMRPATRSRRRFEQGRHRPRPVAEQKDEQHRRQQFQRPVDRRISSTGRRARMISAPASRPGTAAGSEGRAKRQFRQSRDRNQPRRPGDACEHGPVP